jgi:hypothetical protein
MSGLGGPADLAGRNWSNVATGSLDEDLVLTIEWADVPRARSTSTGTVWAQAEADAAGILQLRLIRDSTSRRPSSTAETDGACLEGVYGPKCGSLSMARVEVPAGGQGACEMSRPDAKRLAGCQVEHRSGLGPLATTAHGPVV